MTTHRPDIRPARPFFSSGPCAKHRGWTTERLHDAVLGRSHRSRPGMAKLKAVIDRSASLLGIPTDYRAFIVPASDTGAVELAMWSLLGPRIVDAFVWDTFGAEWMIDAVQQLQIETRVLRAEFGELPDLAKANPAHDSVFVWNGTTSGVCAPDGKWIADDREGLTICDATSAIFAMELPWPKLDATAFSWQKGLGSEAAHGMLVLSPRAIERLELHTPSWPLPKIFRVKKDGKFNAGLFEGETLNTPSMLAVEDYLDALGWAESIGGLPALLARTDRNFSALSRWVKESRWLTFMASDERYRSPSSVCLKIIEPWFAGLAPADQRATVRRFADLLEDEGIAFDVAGHRTAPPGLRIWCGPTVENDEIEALTPWLDWGWEQIRPR
ncbi:MAG TPA: phosphoserine transaminase [Rhizomicrobium sp.]|nr:phosphoserine transaminase [Rhizomicrobium sp.]